MTTLKSRKVRSTLVKTFETVEAVTVLPRQDSHPLDKVIGVFKDEPLMDALMDRVRSDRQAEAKLEADTEQ